MRILCNLGSISCASSAVEAVIRTQDTIAKPKVCLNEGSGPSVTPDLRSAGVRRYARNLCLGCKVVPSIGITAPTCCVLLSLVLTHVSGRRHPGTGHWSLCSCTWVCGFMLFQASCRIPFDRCARGDHPLPLLRRAARSTPIYRGLQEWLNLPLHWRCIFLISIDRAPKIQATATLSDD